MHRGFNKLFITDNIILSDGDKGITQSVDLKWRRSTPASSSCGTQTCFQSSESDGVLERLQVRGVHICILDRVFQLSLPRIKGEKKSGSFFFSVQKMGQECVCIASCLALNLYSYWFGHLTLMPESPHILQQDTEPQMAPDGLALVYETANVWS